MVRVFLDHVTKVFEDKKKRVIAVDDVTLEIPDGKFVGILGPSGCGKTTTLRIIAGLEKPTKGKVYFDDKDVTPLSPKERNVAMIFQFPALYPTLTVYDNIALPLKEAKLSESQIREEIKRMAEFLGISQYLNEKPAKLDMSTKQKVVIAKTLLKDPSLFILDEPLTVVDPKARVEIRSRLKEIQLELRKTMIYVTHDQTEALTLAEQIAVMNEGKIVQFDTPENLYNRPKNTFVGWFIGNPGMNLIEVSTAEENGKLYLVTEGGFKYDVSFLSEEFKKVGSPEKVILGIRPEFVQIGSGPIEANCVHIEFMGNRLIIHLDAYDRRIIAKVSPNVAVKPGSKVLLNFPKEKIMIFDAKSGNLLI
ncbi:MAG: ABC transporter ATP-binding protein [Crenarchaeota archaeon]|nr:ABC transporter ATP-binding protein [Thermoproteota archaeon]MCR8472589.1 ABC transporter ATP-binding protein [Thermoproteota archaeon]